jgi:hypothetical protein
MGLHTTPPTDMDNLFSNLPESRAEARKRGLDRFFTGVPCINGHIAARYVSTTNCVQCQVEHARRNGGWKARPSKEELLGMARERVEAKGGELLSTEYLTAKSKLKIRCQRGHQCEISYDSLKRGKWCGRCKGVNLAERHEAKRWTVDEMREFARREHRGDCLATEPVHVGTKVLWLCEFGHEFLAPPAKVMPSRRRPVLTKAAGKTWCPRCNDIRLRVNPARAPIALEKVEAIVKMNRGEIVQVLGEWKGLQTRLRVRCENRHEWDVTGNNLVHARSWCPECRNKGERIVREIFQATFGTQFPKLRLEWLKGLELDGYSESRKLAFEYQGPHHFQDARVKKRDAFKRDMCAKQGVRLVVVTAVKQPFPITNVFEKVVEAFQQAGIQQLPVLPENIFPSEFAELRRLAKEKGGELVSTVYLGGSKQHEWWCGKPDHRTWSAEPWRVERGAWCPSCAGNRPLGIEGLRAWGRMVGLELLEREYHGATAAYDWRCEQAGHLVRRSKGNIQQSANKGYSGCTICAPLSAVSIVVRKNQADEFALSLLPILEELKRAGSNSLDALAQQLNGRNVPTARGTRWYASTVKNVLDRLSRLRPGF